MLKDCKITEMQQLVCLLPKEFYYYSFLDVYLQINNRKIRQIGLKNCSSK